MPMCNKDVADAQELARSKFCEAVSRPTMHFVPIKTVDCQVSALLLKTRDLLVRQRMQAVNALRGHLGELGIGTAKGLGRVESLIAVIREKTSERLPPVAPK
jgi:transposase